MTNGEGLSEVEQSVVVECHLDEPPAKVWRALTDPALLAAWLMPNDIHPEVGHRFTLLSEEDGTAIDCEVVEVEPERLLSFTWRSTESVGDGEAYTLDSVVSFALTGTIHGGTYLRLVHSGAASVGRWLSSRMRSVNAASLSSRRTLMLRAA